MGQFFTEKIQKNELDVKNLAPVGFDFLRQYFLSVNEKEDKIEKIKPKSSGYNYGRSYGYGNDYRYTWTNTGGYGYNPSASKEKEDKKESKFSIKVLPSNLLELDIIWTLVLQCEHPEVASKVIDFFI